MVKIQAIQILKRLFTCNDQAIKSFNYKITPKAKNMKMNQVTE